MIGLGLVGAFGGAVCGFIGELTHDWNGGTTKPGALGRMFKAVAIGAGLGVGTGWLMTDSKTKDEAAIEECYKQAPAGGTVNITRTDAGVQCAYTR
jgi:hypothetical protein